MAKSKERLTQSLNNANQSWFELTTSDGGGLMCVPAGARVLGLFDSLGENFFWVHPRLDDPTRSRAFMQTPEWKNIGGDRTWVGPEADLHIGDLADPWGTIAIPASVDPGNYIVECDATTIHMTGQTTVQIHRAKTECDIVIDKIVRLTPNPLRRDVTAQEWLKKLDYVGYDQMATISLNSPARPDEALCLWNLIVFPAGGEIIIPILSPAIARELFGGPGGKEHLRINKHSIRFYIDGRKQYKIGVRPEFVTGRAGYLRSVSDGVWTLVVRNFAVNPSAEYVDVPWDDTTDLGYAVECYNDSGETGLFGELEYHTPAIGGETGLTSYLDCSQVWAFRGEEQIICTVGERLLGQGLLTVLEQRI